eukprot:PLAT12037.1.p1 GENE.PLAT12037.1~~PLAT12037.1.p1  ORF type:complete len:803 (+),score=352.32 PLAT12037.1:160-2409(+)
MLQKEVAMLRDKLAGEGLEPAGDAAELTTKLQLAEEATRLAEERAAEAEELAASAHSQLQTALQERDAALEAVAAESLDDGVDAEVLFACETERASALLRVQQLETDLEAAHEDAKASRDLAKELTKSVEDLQAELFQLQLQQQQTQEQEAAPAEAAPAEAEEGEEAAAAGGEEEAEEEAGEAEEGAAAGEEEAAVIEALRAQLQAAEEQRDDLQADNADLDQRLREAQQAVESAERQLEEHIQRDQVATRGLLDAAEVAEERIRTLEDAVSQASSFTTLRKQVLDDCQSRMTALQESSKSPELLADLQVLADVLDSLSEEEVQLRSELGGVSNATAFFLLIRSSLKEECEEEARAAVSQQIEKLMRATERLLEEKEQLTQQLAGARALLPRVYTTEGSEMELPERVLEQMDGEVLSSVRALQNRFALLVASHNELEEELIMATASSTPPAAAADEAAAAPASEPSVTTSEPDTAAVAAVAASNEQLTTTVRRLFLLVQRLVSDKQLLVSDLAAAVDLCGRNAAGSSVGEEEGKSAETRKELRRLRRRLSTAMRENEQVVTLRRQLRMMQILQMLRTGVRCIKFMSGRRKSSPKEVRLTTADTRLEWGRHDLQLESVLFICYGPYSETLRMQQLREVGVETWHCVSISCKKRTFDFAFLDERLAIDFVLGVQAATAIVQQSFPPGRHAVLHWTRAKLLYRQVGLKLDKRAYYSGTLRQELVLRAVRDGLRQSTVGKKSSRKRRRRSSRE